MMIKRKAAVSLLFLAGILFLGHAVVPHHHHGNLVCLAQSHCTDEDSGGDHGSGPDNHHHDGEGGAGHCFLKDPVVVSSNQFSAGLKIPDSKSSHPWNNILFIGQETSETCLPAPGLTQSSSLARDSFLHSALSSASLGLRAPPLA